VLYGRRKLRSELEEREARGESFLTTDFEPTVRNRVLYVFSRDGTPTREFQQAREILLRELGLLNLSGNAYANWADDFMPWYLTCDDDDFPNAIEALLWASADPNRTYRAAEVNAIMREHRVSFEVIDGEMIPFSSRVMHVDVVEPAIHLLRGRPDLMGAEVAFRKALEEISRGDAPDAITDAGTALQQALEGLGFEGKSLGPLINDAKGKGFLGPHDSNLTSGIAKFLDWASADRSNSGDTHNADEATLADAWLAVHVVGALILRLADGPRHSRSADDS